MRLRIEAVAFVEVPDSSLGGAATPEAVIDLAKRTVAARLTRIWKGWDSSGEVSAAIVPDVVADQREAQS